MKKTRLLGKLLASACCWGLLLLGTWQVQAQCPGSTLGVQVTEILADPNSNNANFDTDGNGSADTSDEFVEICNVTGAMIDISNFEIYDETTATPFTFPAGTMLAAGSCVVVMSAWNGPGAQPANYFTGLPSMNNGGDQALIYNPNTNAYAGATYNGTPVDATNLLAAHPGATQDCIDDFGNDTDGESVTPTGSGTPSPGTYLACDFTLIVGVPVCDANTAGTDSYTVPFTYTDGDGMGTYTVSATGGTLTTTSITNSASGNLEITGGMEGSAVSITISDGAGCEITEIVNAPSCLPVGLGNCLTDNCDFAIVPVTQNSQSDNWVCTGGSYTANGFVGGGTTETSDLWLVLGSYDLSGTSTVFLNLDAIEGFNGSGLEIFYSASYTGCPSDGGNAWTSAGTIPSGGGSTNLSYNLSGAAGASAVYIAIQYLSGSAGGTASNWTVENVTLEADVCPTLNAPIANNCVVVYDCPALSLNIGDACDDMDAGTINDLVLADCSCAGTAVGACPSGAKINEFHYDNAGTDANEFIEIAIPVGGDPTQVIVDLYNGNGGATYDTYTLSAADLAGSDATFDYYVWSPAGGMQNGNDGIAISCLDGSTIEFITYEGAFMATDGPFSGMMGTDVGVAEDPNATTDAQSIQCDGMGGYGVDCLATPGATNDVSTCGVDDCPGLGNIGDFCDDMDATTTNDVLQADCSCAGTPPAFDCPALGLNIGDACDDMNAGTAGDVVQADCSCAGSTLGICPAGAKINEFHYDNTSTDMNEFVEIALPVGADASQVTITLYNGNGGTAYDTYTLTAADLVSSDATFDYYVWNSFANGIQNGNDGIAISCLDGSQLEFITYEGAFMATDGPFAGVMGVDVGVAENGGVTTDTQSIQCDGMGGYGVDCVATPGATNDVSTCDVDDCPGVGDVGDFCDDMDATTQNDVIQADCSCAGTPFDCPALGLNIGDACDDMNAGTGNDAVQADCTCAGSTVGVCPAGAKINEFHYDNAGTDANEFVEIAVPVGTDATQITITLYNGNGGTVYNNYTLSATDLVSSDATYDYYVWTSIMGGIQNGDDGIAISCLDGSQIEFITYEGAFMATDGPFAGMMGIDVGVAETGSTTDAQSVQCDGMGGYAVDCPSTAGATNDVNNCGIEGCLDVCDPNYDAAATVSNAALCAGYDTTCDDGCEYTADSYNSTTCACESVLTTPSCDDGNCATDDIYNESTCECEYFPIPQLPCNNDCTLGDITVYNPDNCQCEVTVVSVFGCTDAAACNYDTDATCDDGSCLELDCENNCGGSAVAGEACNDFDPTTEGEVWTVNCICEGDAVEGCIDPCAPNYNSNAVVDNDSCDSYDTTCDTDICTNGGTTVWEAASCSCIVDQTTLSGCTDATACNYNPAANCDDSSCDFGNAGCVNPCDIIIGCTDPDACNYNPTACEDDGQCIAVGCFPGCTDPCAPNYNPSADSDNGTCQIYDTSCDTDICTNGGTTVWDATSCSCVASVATVNGCTDATACNYNPAANCDDSSCDFGNAGCVDPCDIIIGCTDPDACNYNPNACVDDGECIAIGCAPGCTDPCALNYNPTADSDDGGCIPYDATCDTDICTNGGTTVWEAASCSCIVAIATVNGCTDVNACNYNPAANCDDNTCDFGEVICNDPCNPVSGCTDATACNYNSAACVNDGSCDFGNTACMDPCNLVMGCTEPVACNYNPAACIDDGSCAFEPCNPGCIDPCAPNYDSIADGDDGSCEDYDTTCDTDLCTNGGTYVWDEFTCACVLDQEPVLGCTDVFACNYNSAAECDDNSCDYGAGECTDPCNPIPGCTDIFACNYTPGSNCDDNSCEYGTFTECPNPCDPYLGCTDATACNYVTFACVDDGSCTYAPCLPGCTDPCASNYDSMADEDDGSCEDYDNTCDTDICTNGGSYEWDSFICECTLLLVTVSGCTDATACNYNANANCNDDSCDFGVAECVDPCNPIFGCTDPINTVNYDSNACVDDGSCTYGPDCGGCCSDPCAPNYNPLSEIYGDDGSCEPYDSSCDTDICTNGGSYIWDFTTCGCTLDVATISGCMDATACNYDANANCDDDSCDFGNDTCDDPCNIIIGCTDSEADNYNSSACVDDGSCEFGNNPGCDDPCAPNFDSNSDTNDGCLPYDTTCDTDICTNGGAFIWDTPSCSCVVDVATVSGCTNPAACNYDATANCDDDSCDFGNTSCDDPCNPLMGCTDATACNYDATACIDNGSCEFTSCLGGLTTTVYVDANINNNFDTGDIPIEGALVAISDGTNSFTFVTDANGEVTATGLAPGSYTVDVTLPGSFIFANGSNSVTLTGNVIPNTTTVVGNDINQAAIPVIFSCDSIEQGKCINRQGALFADDDFDGSGNEIYTWYLVNPDGSNTQVAQFTGVPYYSPGELGDYFVIVYEPDFDCEQEFDSRSITTLDGCCELGEEDECDN